MYIFEALVAYLLAQSTVTNLVNDRIFPDFIPQEEDAPAIVYDLVSGTVDYTLSGQQRLRQPIIQIATYAYTNKEAYEIFDAINELFKDYQGTMSGLEIQHVELIEEPIKDYEADTKRHSYKADFKFWYI
jgi:hypothetical protein